LFDRVKVHEDYFNNRKSDKKKTTGIAPIEESKEEDLEEDRGVII
jgi:hypothetical protein